MTTKTHTQSIQQMLAKSDRQFAAGDARQGSATLWRAAECAMTAVAKQRGWAHDDNNALFAAAKRLAEEQGDRIILSEYLAAEIFRDNAQYGYLEDYEIEAFVPPTHDTIYHLLSFVEEPSLDEAATA